jgi:choline dehydrogenase
MGGRRPLQWDHIVIGGGSAGAVLAARLSERPDRQVLLIEAGGGDGSPRIRVPGLVESAIDSPTLNWHYRGEPDASLDGRRLEWAGGRVLGGSSSINGMVCGRGLPADYARWVAAGNPGWGWNDLLPWFRHLEHWTGAPHAARGQGGPIHVRRFEDTDPACRAAMSALIGQGVPEVPDYCVGICEGVGLTQATQKDGWRHSTAAAYLRPARRRANLQVMTQTRALRLRLHAARCTGVQVLQRGRLLELTAAREVSVAAGAIASPKLLLLSGIGGADALEPLGLPVIHPLAGVGRHLNEHVNVLLSAHVNRPTYNSQRRGLDALRSGLRFIARGDGPASSPANHVQAFIRSEPGDASADLQIQLMAFGFGTPAQMRRDGITAVVSLCRPEARGRITLRSADPLAAPCIAIELLAHEADRRRLLLGCRIAEAALHDGPGRTLGATVYAPERGTVSDADWLAFMRARAGLNWHPTSSCRMGPGPDDVVDTALRVHGLSGLSIVDASVMPSVTSANTHVPVVAIAERAAELIALRTA